jgi:hypothetical protein
MDFFSGSGYGKWGNLAEYSKEEINDLLDELRRVGRVRDIEEIEHANDYEIKRRYFMIEEREVAQRRVLRRADELSYAGKLLTDDDSVESEVVVVGVDKERRAFKGLDILAGRLPVGVRVKLTIRVVDMGAGN